ncbi:MAG: hypothetical protein J0I77_05030 [Rudaea sp.]|uniref:asparagine synthase-related protein n=1 Tax=unclassified Rudaea TaxID=2627037 RepID=UPI0010F4E072|nr:MULTISPECIES: asparagine synthase-related protein [unclassified Rudaea]MBN8885060.1 hypothetical protein [Rudaea sp.]MBR0347129.1 hypothetical protein [Rudaea sp.]
MLKADLAFSDLAAAPQWQNDVLTLGESRIAPFFHAALEALLVGGDGQWFVIVRERMADSDRRSAGRISNVICADAEHYHRLYRECLLWPLDYVMIEVAPAGGRIRVRCGVFGTAPVYCQADSDRLTISWDFADFLSRSLTVDAETASHYLALNACYSARQICSGIVLLTERSSFYVTREKAHYQYPDAAKTPEPLDRQNDDDLQSFGELLRHSVSMRAVTPAQVALELSGGMDSASVACALRAAHGPVASRGILMNGTFREAQIERRQRIVQRLGLRDESIEMDEFLPSLDLQPSENKKSYPRWEFYLEAFENLWDSARAQGCDLLFTGLGGDELFPKFRNEVHADGRGENRMITEARRRAELLLTPRARNAARSLRAFDAPASPVPVSALLAHACQTPYLLGRGFWPVNPLSDPSLAAFCHRLAPQNRHGRALMREYLQTHLGEEVFPHGYLKETFARVLPKLIVQQAQTIAAQLRHCALADLGLVDQRAALALLNEAATTQAEGLTAPLANFLWLERFARQIA